MLTKKGLMMAMAVVGILLLSSLFVPASQAMKGENVKVMFLNGLGVKYHFLSEVELKNLMKSVGIREEGKNYNKIIDGHGTGLAPPSEEEWRKMVNSLRVTEGVVSTRDLPMKLDLSKDKYFPPVGDQGAQGSCAAWAVTYYAYTYIEAKDNDWDAASGNRTHIMSPAWTYNRVNNAQDQGSSFEDNGNVLKNWGSASIATMPYFDSTFTNWGSSAAMREAPLHRIKDYSYIENDGHIIDTIKNLLNQGIPVNFGIDADIYDDAFKDGNYIISSSEYSRDLTPNHGQTIIGYDDTVTDDGDVGAFKIVNSWGSSFGDSGFYWVTYKAFEDEMDYNDRAFPFYLIDESDYTPRTVAILEFDKPPEWDVDINFTVGTETKSLYYGKELPGLHAKIPNFIAYDISDIVPTTPGTSLSVKVNVSESTDKNATLKAIYIENYGGSWNYIPGFPSQISSNPVSSPTSLPYLSTVNFDLYSNFDFNSAVDNSDLSIVIHDYNPLNAHWVSEPYIKMSGESAMQTVPMGDYGRCVMKATVVGPGLLTFHWKASSEKDHDILYFYVENRTVANISGETDWVTVSVLVGGGTRNLTWVYQKDGMGSSGLDMAWVDAIEWEKRNDKVPSPPQNVRADFGNGYVNITWSAPASNGGAEIWGYAIYRGVNGTNFTRVGYVNNKTFYFNDTNVENGVNYTYFIRAENYVGLGNKSEMITGIPGTPGPVLNLKAQGGSGVVTLTWSPPARTGGAEITEYRIYRKDGDTWKLVATVSGDKTKFEDKTVENNKVYYYRVSAVNKYGEGEKSDEVKAQTADIVLNIGDTPRYMSYGEFGMYVAIIIVIIAAIVLAVKKLRAKKKVQRSEESGEETPKEKQDSKEEVQEEEQEEESDEEEL